jgi:DHA1 family inner membrane transport protein
MVEGSKKSQNRLLLLSLVLSAFATQPQLIIMMLLLIDISKSFNTPVGITGQITTSASILGVIFAILMSLLSVRYRHKTLLLIGLAFFVISALGCYLAVDYNIMLIAYALTGVGGSMINPMQSTITAANYRLEQRSKVIGWTMAGTSIVALIGSPLVSYLSSISDWRLPFIVFMFPVALASLIISYFGIPPVDRGEGEKTSYIDSLRKILTNRSAVTCLLGTTLASAAWGGSLTYGISFFRQNFGLATAWASILLSAMALSKTVGHLWSGSLINKVGRKNFTVFSVAALGGTTFAYFNVGMLWVSMFAVCISCFVAGFQDSSLSVLNLEQVPDSRGPMMSFHSAMYRVGSTLGAGVGGLTLLLFNYGILGMVFGFFSFASTILYLLYAKDPTSSN